MKAMKAMKAMKKKTVSKSQPFKHKLFLYYNGQGNEGDEGHGSHEGHESHEEEDRDQGKEGIGPQGLRRNQEGLCSLQEGQGALPVNMNMPVLQLRVWGCLRPSSAVALDGHVY